jgi:hypothetical protein
MDCDLQDLYKKAMLALRGTRTDSPLKRMTHGSSTKHLASWRISNIMGTEATFVLCHAR